MGADGERVRAEIDATSRELLLAEPYFGHLFVGLVRVVADERTKTALVPHGHTLALAVGAAHWAKLPEPRMRRAALKHELVHLTFKHPFRARGVARLDLWGVACDLVVHQIVDPHDIPDAVTLASFPGLSLPRDRSAEEYYAALLPLYERLACKGGASRGEGGGGACAGGEGDGGAAPSADEAALLRALRESAASHASWAEIAALPSATCSVMEANVDALVESTVRRARARRWGALPGMLLEHLEALVDGKSEVSWRRVVRLFGTTSERTYLKNTIARPSKRYGTCPGLRVKRRTDLLVALDCSGSVPTEDIALFFSEVHGLYRRGAVVTIVEFDTRVASEYPYRGTPPKMVGGRGGTSFEPAIERANELRPDGLITFTDGEAPAPKTRSRVPMLWVLSREGRSLDEATHLPGRRIKLRR